MIKFFLDFIAAIHYVINKLFFDKYMKQWCCWFYSLKFKDSYLQFWEIKGYLEGVKFLWKKTERLKDFFVYFFTDKSKFGYQMLTKMGWSEGKGLGHKENGSLSHVKVNKRKTNAGFSFLYFMFREFFFFFLINLIFSFSEVWINCL